MADESNDASGIGGQKSAKGSAFFEYGLSTIAFVAVAIFYWFIGFPILGALFCLPAALFLWGYFEVRSVDVMDLSAESVPVWQHWVAVGLFFPIAVWAYHTGQQVICLLLIMFGVTALLKLHGESER